MRRGLLLVGTVVAVFVACNRGDMPSLLKQQTAHESYAQGLRAAGLADTALGRDWLAAAETALRDATAIALPLDRTLRFTAAQAVAYGFRVELQRGRIFRAEITHTGDAPATVFVDLFTPEEDRQRFRHVASAAREQRVIEHEVTHTGRYIVRVQPELLRGGSLRIAQRTMASLAFPVPGRTRAAVGSVFGDERDGGRRDHHGIDIFAPRETPVIAASDGIVTGVGTNRLGGNVVWVWDPERSQSYYYAHLSRQAVSVGERVEAGEVVGYVGNTGNARTTPPHLHFGIYSFGEGAIDPLPFINAE